MLYYTIYVKGLNNGTGYIDVALPDDQLLKDFVQMLDVNVKPVRTYPMASSGVEREKPVSDAGKFVINLSEVTAISVTTADSKPVTLPPSDPTPGH